MRAFRLSLVASLLAASAAGAVEPDGFDLPTLPEVTVAFDEAPAPQAIPAPETIAETATPETATPQVEPAEIASPAVAPPDIALPDLPAVVVAVPPLDPVTAALRERLADPALRLHPRLPAAQVASLQAFYAARDHRPLFVEAGAPTALARAVADRLRAAEADALDPAHYPLPALGERSRADAPADLAAAELAVAASVTLYARDARGGRIEPARLSRHVTPRLALPDAGDVLAPLAGARDPGAALQAYNPPHEGYQALRERLAEIRARRPARSAARLPGEADLVANMERWRWLPAELGERHVFVDIAAYRLRVVEGGRTTHAARVMVGKPERPTPVFSQGMTHLVVNPSWTVPPTILRKDLLPALQADPSAAARRGLEVFRNGRRVDPYSVDWSNLKGLSLRQPPGERNALGQMKFMFPNDHAVYIHDTPARGGFRAERRALSSGCVRVEQPFRLAEAVLEDAGAEARLKRLIGERAERTVPLRRPLPVHLAYFTLMPDETGRLQSRPDIYGLDEAVKAALGLRG